MQPVLAVCRIGLQHDPHLVRGGHRPVGAALLRKLSLQSEEGRISFQDLGVDLGAEIFGGFERCSRFHRAVWDLLWGLKDKTKPRAALRMLSNLALGPPRHPLSAAQTV
jgi:hypothetical protein